ncbi:MAG: ComF family protein [bacterium]
MTIFNAFVDFIWPPKCLICDNSLENGEKFICDECEKAVILFSPVDSRFRRNDAFSRKFIIGSYENSLREAIHQFKYNKRIALRKYFSVLINDYIERNNVLDKVDIIIPVPLFPTKKRERGFNQSELLANEIDKKWNLAVSSKNLYRARHTEPQNKLNYSQRKRNIKGAFRLKNKNSVKGKSVLLVDDIVTTGATVNECSKVLKKDGKVKNVLVLSLAGK